GGTRIRGASWRKVTPSDTIIAIAAGVPVTGSKVESKRVAVPTFGGFVAGGRLISDNGAQDIGVSASISEDGETGALVAGGQKSYHFDNDSKGLQSAYIAADLGVFSGDESTADIRARATINYAINEQVGISAAANYEGSEFASGRATSTFEGVFDQRVGARTNLSAGANWRADEPWGAFNRVAFGLRTSLRHEGGEADRTAVNVSANMNTQIGESGPNVSVTLQQTSESTPDVDRDSTSLRVRGLQRYDWGSVTASYTHSSSDDSPTSEQFVATVQANPIRKTFEKEVRVQVAPNATLNWDGETTRAYLGASAIADSGRLLGSKLDILGRVSAFSNFSAEDENANTTQFLGSLEARYRLNRAAHLTAVYTDDFQGRQDLSLALRGTVTFNPPRQSRLPDEGRGLLNGRVFLDRNRDGIRQEDEPGVPGVRVMLVGTRLGLNTNIDGHFTIQNVNQGLYTVTINRKSLPLGYLVPEEAQPRVTIGSGRRTDVEIPLILSGQVRGAVFIDDNANGVTDPGEKRLEGQWVTLIPENGGESQVIHSASFGQYGFENVDPGIYTLRTTVSGRPVSQQITISGEDPFVIVPIPIPPDLTSKGGGVDLSAGVLGEP
ncbi:MAG: SdrD B-like domain-containing protein, partial [Pseudomonadota bacterium]